MRISAVWLVVAAVATRPGPALADDPGDLATIHVTGKPMVVNGQRDVPRGLFGVHAAKWDVDRSAELGVDAYRGIHFRPSANSYQLDRDGKPTPLAKRLAVVIDCQGDRYQHPLALEDRNFRSYFQRIGRQFGERTRKAGVDAYAEFWNEPYLNWAERSHGGRGSVYQAKWYDDNGRTDGGRVTIKGWRKPLDHLRWRQFWAKGADGQFYYGVPIPDGLKPGDTFDAASPWYWTNRKTQTFTVTEHWSVHDPSSPRWWSGKQNVQLYRWMLEPYARALKQANPDARVLVGWDFAYWRGDWSVFRDLCQPLIDGHIEQIDGLTEHHFGAHARATTGAYEVGTAYAMAKHGKWLRHYNTQCNGRLWAAPIGLDKVDPARKRTVNFHAARAAYTLSEVLELLHRCPAKAGSRMIHEPNTGDWLALKLLRDVRGQLVHATDDDENLWHVAAVHGDRLVVAVFNNGPGGKVKLRVDAPTGSTLTGATQSTIGVDDSNQLGIITTNTDAAGDSAELMLDTLPRQAVVIAFGLEGEVDTEPTVRRTQHFAKQGTLIRVAPSGTTKLTIDSPRRDLTAATLRLVFNGYHEGVTAHLNGKPVDMLGGEWTCDTAVPVGLLKEANTLTITGGEQGVLVCAASLIVDGPAK